MRSSMKSSMRKGRKKFIAIVIFLFLVASVGVVGSIVFRFSPAAAIEWPLRVAFLDVGQGDAIFIETPDGTQVLIDGGATNRVLLELDKLMSFGDDSIDLVIATHPDKDHIGGLIPVLAKYKVGQIIESPAVNDTKTFTTFREAVLAEQGKRIFAEAGDTIWLDRERGIYLKVFSPFVSSAAAGNEASVVAELRYGTTEFLFTGDIGFTTEATLVSVFGEELATDVLKVAHHGSRYSSGAEFLAIASPGVAVISAGAKNPYGHPHPDTLARLAKQKIPVIGTYKEGMIIFESDGKTIERAR